jgi:hypothetical protein
MMASSSANVLYGCAGSGAGCGRERPVRRHEQAGAVPGRVDRADERDALQQPAGAANLNSETTASMGTARGSPPEGR